jgi:hypothetical protein
VVTLCNFGKILAGTVPGGKNSSAEPKTTTDATKYFLNGEGNINMFSEKEKTYIQFIFYQDSINGKNHIPYATKDCLIHLKKYCISFKAEQTSV